MSEKLRRAFDDIIDVSIFVFKDTITLALLVIGLKVGEIILSIAFTEQHPFVTYVRGFTWIPFIIVYFYLILKDLLAFVRGSR